MKKIFSLLVFVLPFFTEAQDTTITQSLTFQSTGRSMMVNFPLDSGQSYERIIMRYRMRCKEGLISNSTDRNKGCGEWDYSCNTYITDPNYTDSVKAVHPSHIISGFSGTTFNYTTNPTYNYYRFVQKDVQHTSTSSQSIATVSGTLENISHPFGLSAKRAKTQYLFTASELSLAGLTAGNITDLRVENTSAFAENANYLKIRMKHSSKTVLSDSDIDNDGFTEVYFLNSSLTSGQNEFRFYTPFNWNGTSNVIVEFSYENKNSATDIDVSGHDAGFVSTLVSAGEDCNLEFSGTSYVDLNPTPFQNISNQITIAFWTYGNAVMPRNSTIFEASDALNRRQANVHLPWENSSVYWDCGNDGSGYDRIEKAATVNDIKGKWNYWAFTKNASTGEMKIYLNGVLWHSGTGKNKSIDIENFRVGSAVTSTNPHYGKVDEFQVWNIELSESTIRDWMNKSITSSHPNYTNLMAYYPFNEGSGNSVNDYSSFGLISNVVGVAQWSRLRANEHFKQFSQNTKRPNLDFIKGVYTNNITDQIVIDSVLNTQTSIINFQLSGTDVVPIDTNYVWKGGYEYLYNENGSKADSFLISTNASVNISNLNYYRKSASKFEIMSFVTPYGIGLDLGMEGKMWEFDVTDFKPILSGTKLLTMERGGEYQEQMDISFVFISGTPPRDVHDIRQIWRNDAIDYANIQNNNYFEPKNHQLNLSSSMYKIMAAITGHGQEGEFIPQTHYLDINGGTKEVEWQVWKECADNPIYPQGGTWIFDRAGWCPGAATDVKELEITDMVSPGQTISIDYGVNGGSGDSRYIVNAQIVSYGNPNFSLDARVLEVKRPSNRTEFERINPACQEPIVVIQNVGSTTLTSLKITYQVNGGTAETFDWTGSLKFLEKTEVVLPIPSYEFWKKDSNKFIVSLSQPNGGADEYAQNDVYVSEFIPADVLPNYINLNVLTNKRPHENRWTLKDLDGNILIDRSYPDIDKETLYEEFLEFKKGCYTFELYDDMAGSYGQNGLSFWYYSQFGNGGIEIIEPVSKDYLKFFNSDFGAFVKYDFIVEEDFVGTEGKFFKSFNIFPNPASDYLNIEFVGFSQQSFDIKIYDATGKLMKSVDYKVSNTKLFIGDLPQGYYIIKADDGKLERVRKFVKI